MSTFSFTIDGTTMQVIPSNHALLRMRQRGIELFATYGSIVALGDKLLDMKKGEEFCIIDKELNIAVCCAIQCEGIDINVYITTVLDNSLFFVKDGVTVYELAI